jgi:hypothetical protein
MTKRKKKASKTQLLPAGYNEKEKKTKSPVIDPQ